MASLIENPKIDKHVSGSLGEYRVLYGEGFSDKLKFEYKTEVNLLLAKTACSFSSRPFLTESRRQGLHAMKEAIKFKIPGDAETFNIKMDFYRLPQLTVKGLRLYYGIEITNTAQAIHLLRQKGKLSPDMASNLLELMEVLTRVRTKAQLHAGYELDDVLTKPPVAPTVNYVLPDGELKELKAYVPFMKRVKDRAIAFVAAKEQYFGPRGNPFANNHD